MHEVDLSPGLISRISATLSVLICKRLRVPRHRTVR
jgi:hypothetical protein